MLDKAAFLSTVLLCVQLFVGNKKCNEFKYIWKFRFIDSRNVYMNLIIVYLNTFSLIVLLQKSYLYDW